jgi:N-methylhydantoinase A/oxoprolinase/acetone carboxylase beta subunit
MAFLIGIDTGGTYTDAVLLDETKGVIATAKSLTTKNNLTTGIRDSLVKLLEKKNIDIQLVSLSSTLATNAITEGKGRPACLILIGYDDDILRHEMFATIQDENKIFLVKGGHLISGEEKDSLNKNQIEEIVRENEAYVSAFAVSGYFSVRNPMHELEAKSIIRRMTNLPVTCGHELTSSLDAPKRAMTTLLNARLIPLLYELIHSVKDVLSEFKIHAPLMIVKGDGSLISSDAALEVPVETILSGPAASIAGARHLTEEKNGLIIDMGGTTSDMAVLKCGHPIVSENNPDIGGFHPMVESIDIFTKGIGGDSFIKATTESSIFAGPERVLPLCLLGKIHPKILEPLTHSPDHKKAVQLPLFIYTETTDFQDTNIPTYCTKVLHLLEQGPLFVPDILTNSGYPSAYEQSIRFLIKNNLVSAASFTPTDAVNILGHYKIGSSEAASLNADFIAKRLKTDAVKLCEKTFSQIQQKLGRAIIDCAIRSEKFGKKIGNDASDSLFIQKALEGSNDDILSCQIVLGCPIIALGAPSGTYLSGVASLLNCTIIIPEHSDVANAIGAVTGTIAQNSRVFIKQIQGGRSYRTHSGQGVRIFDRYDKAEEHAIEVAKQDASEKAILAGAGHTEIKLNKKAIQVGDSTTGNENKVIIEAEITVTAVGRPRMEEYGGYDA